MSPRLTLVPTTLSSTVTPSRMEFVPIFGIRVPDDRARTLDPLMVEALAAIIADRGLLHPITVRDTGEDLVLVAGLRRLRAVQALGWTEVPVVFSLAENDEEARRDELMENLGREELIALDRCHHLYELSRIHNRLHPAAKLGGRPKSGKSFPTLSEIPEIFGFAASVAERIGLSKRAINNAVKIWNGLSADSRKGLVGTGLADKQTELKALSEEPHPRQAKILALILGDEHPSIESVAEALAFLDGGTEVAGIEKQYRAVNTAFGRLSDTAVDMVTANHADRIIASLKRLGRI